MKNMFSKKSVLKLQANQCDRYLSNITLLRDILNNVNNTRQQSNFRDFNGGGRSNRKTTPVMPTGPLGLDPVVCTIYN